MTERLNIVSVYCTLDSTGDNAGDVDNVDESKTDLHQKVRRNYINNLFDIAFEYIGQTNRIILKTPNGAEIAYSGPPEDAMRIATDILNQILIASKKSTAPLSARIGIHLQPVHLVEDFNAQSNIVGSSINMAKQVAMHAKANHILVSPAYYENISAETQAFTTVFDDQVSQPETPVVSHQADSVDLEPVNLDPDNSNSASDLAKSKSEDLNFIDAALEDLSIAESNMQFTENYLPVVQQPIILGNTHPVEISKSKNGNEWKYVIAISLIMFIILFTIKSTFVPIETAPPKTAHTTKPKAENPDVTTPDVTTPEVTTPEVITPVVTDSEVINEEAPNPEAKIEETTEPEITKKIKPQPDNANFEDQNIEPVREETVPVVENKPVEKEIKQKPKEKPDSTTQKNNIKELLKWETFKKSLKQGKKKECTQSEIALNQCKK